MFFYFSLPHSGSLHLNSDHNSENSRLALPSKEDVKLKRVAALHLNLSKDQ